MGSPVRGFLLSRSLVADPFTKVVVSWVMVFVRREIFASKFKHVVQTEIARRVANKMNEPVEVQLVPWWKRAARMLVGPRLSTIPEATNSTESTAREREKDRDRKHTIANKLRPDMIRRMNDAPKLVDPSGYISEGQTPHVSTNVSPNTSTQLSAARQEFDSALHSVTEEAERDVGRPQTEDSESESEDSVGREKSVILVYIWCLRS